MRLQTYSRGVIVCVQGAAVPHGVGAAPPARRGHGPGARAPAPRLAARARARAALQLP